jgi:hypothetical protein
MAFLQSTRVRNLKTTEEDRFSTFLSARVLVSVLYCCATFSRRCYTGDDFQREHHRHGAEQKASCRPRVVVGAGGGSCSGDYGDQEVESAPPQKDWHPKIGAQGSQEDWNDQPRHADEWQEGPERALGSPKTCESAVCVLHLVKGV